MTAPTFPVWRIHQIEMTSRCNLKCRYCVHPKMPRPKIDMDLATWEQSLKQTQLCVWRYGQDELNICGIGESTMHPNFVEWIHMARGFLGPAIRLVLATNGLLVDDALAKAIAPARPLVWVSAHRPEKAGPAIEALKRAGIFAGVSVDPSVSSVDWAGQVDWHVSAQPSPCQWVREGRVFVTAEGKITACCFDSADLGVIGSIWDDLDALQTRPYSLCGTCHQRLNIPGYNQYPNGKPIAAPLRSDRA